MGSVIAYSNGSGRLRFNLPFFRSLVAMIAPVGFVIRLSMDSHAKASRVTFTMHSDTVDPQYVPMMSGRISQVTDVRQRRAWANCFDGHGEPRLSAVQSTESAIRPAVAIPCADAA
jgi:hypothetical protein